MSQLPGVPTVVAALWQKSEVCQVWGTTQVSPQRKLGLDKNRNSPTAEDNGKLCSIAGLWKYEYINRLSKNLISNIMLIIKTV